MGITSEQHSSASSIDSSSDPSAAAATSSSSFCAPMQSNNSARFDLSTDLRLGLSISSSYHNDLFPTPTTTARVQPLSWPPIRSILRSARLDKALDQKQASLFIKIYMEGIPIDKEGDWTMVGDVPWELFLNNVKRLKITRADRC